MSLKYKVLFACVTLLLATALLNYAVLRGLTFSAFKDLEIERSERDVLRVQGALSNRLEVLGNVATDWAVWTDTYDYANGLNPHFEENLILGSLTGANINLLYIVDNQGKLLWKMAADLSTEEEIDTGILGNAPQELASAMWDMHREQGLVTGVITTNMGPMMLASHTILRNDDSGPAAGAVIMGRVFGAREASAVGQQLQTDFEIFSRYSLPSNVPDNVVSILGSGEMKTYIDVTRANSYGYIVMPSLLGKSFMLVRSTTPRSISELGNQAIVYTMIALLVAGFLAATVSWLYLRRRIVRPMEDLDVAMTSILEGDHEYEVPLQDVDDEIGRFAKTLDSFRENLKERHQIEITLHKAYEDLEQEHSIQEHLTRRLAESRDIAESANRTKSSFLANMSHELRTPLNAIIGFSSVMSEEVFGELGNDKYKGYVRDITDSGEHLLSIIDDILDVSKIEAGTFELHPEVGRIDDVVRSALTLTKERAHNAGVSVSVEGVETFPAIDVDRRKIKQVLLNLISNSIKFTDNGGSVNLALSYNVREGAVIRITDTGVGIAEDQIDHVLEPFGRVSTDRNYEGTGLGLPLSKSLIELHDGTFALESELGVGTCISITLPESRIVHEEDIQNSA